MCCYLSISLTYCVHIMFSLPFRSITEHVTNSKRRKLKECSSHAIQKLPDYQYVTRRTTMLIKLFHVGRSEVVPLVPYISNHLVCIVV
jgi:hypothetical protein